MQDLPEYTAPQVAAHNSRNDLWIVIRGKVYDITSYVRDHPGGADVLIESAGTDATEAYEDVGHSEDADEILQTYLIGTLKDARKQSRPQAVRIIQPPPPAPAKPSASKLKALALASFCIGAAGISVYFGRRIHTTLPVSWPGGLKQFRQWPRALPTPGGFATGFAAATIISTVIGSIVARKLSAMTQIASGFTRYPPHVKSRRGPRSNPHLVKGFLDPKEYKSLPLIRKEALSSSVFKFVFQLPTPQTVIGLPIGQHVAIKGDIDGVVVSRSYTPTSNNLDRGVLELVIKCYPDGLLTGRYLANLQIGEHAQFRGPKGAMKYTKGLCKKIGMIAGGTGITPMYQLIRAICEDATDLTEVSLIYANRSEEDILLREELEAFGQANPRNLKVWYMLDVPPENWTYGTGYVTAEIMKERLPPSLPDTKVMLCGPPGMVNASKKALVSLGYQAPGAVAKMSDQIFCF
ncbi:Putative NADH-cytochrome b-5 reductase [Aspergillus calidoustus]|uniref:Putative NADH-cytochrome b-5 reductase n=1 Tax=Aspergillus calidoustus TaxID=454130 RepID=A0A0U5CHW3_ASPCI|nr:Putative NADH-cytochrome b-5 reductase [Aspergillus calidoustus]